MNEIFNEVWGVRQSLESCKRRGERHMTVVVKLVEVNSGARSGLPTCTVSTPAGAAGTVGAAVAAVACH